jgi:hypothetical protein
MKPFSIFAALGMALAVSACTTVLSGVQNFSDPTVSYAGKSFAVRPIKGQETGLEYDDYAGYVASKLTAYGMVQAPLGQADFVAAIQYGVDDGRTVSGTTPIYGQTGGGEAAHSGTIEGPDGTATYSGTSYTPETYGVVDEIEWSKTDYTRSFDLVIVDGRSVASGEPEQVYQANAISIGKENNFHSVSRCVIDTVFDRFPDVSGATRFVSARGDKCMR